MKTDMHTASSLPLLAEYHATLQQHTGFYDELSIDAKKASLLESHAGIVSLLYTSPRPRDGLLSRMRSAA